MKRLCMLLILMILSTIVSCKGEEEIQKTPEVIKDAITSNLALELKEDKDCASKNKKILKAYVEKSDEYTKVWLEYNKVKNENTTMKKSLELYADMIENAQRPSNIKNKTKNSNNETNKLINSIQQKDIENSNLRNDSIVLSNKIKQLEKDLDIEKKSNNTKDKTKTTNKAPFYVWIIIIVVSFTFGIVSTKLPWKGWFSFLPL